MFSISLSHHLTIGACKEGKVFRARSHNLHKYIQQPAIYIAIQYTASCNSEHAVTVQLTYTDLRHSCWRSHHPWHPQVVPGTPKMRINQLRLENWKKLVGTVTDRPSDWPLQVGVQARLASSRSTSAHLICSYIWRNYIASPVVSYLPHLCQPIKSKLKGPTIGLLFDRPPQKTLIASKFWSTMYACSM